MHTTSVDILGENGLLSREISGFVPRAAQQEMATAIERAIVTESQLLVEAGTGTGKTFAYLIPIFLANKKTIISTGTKNLQDQLFFKDIPVIRKLLSANQKVVLLKGRANYLCLQRLQRATQDGRLPSRETVNELQTVKAWSYTTQWGDISELNFIPEDSAVWPHVTSTIDNCLGQDCPLYKDCFLVKVRQQALAADIVIVNHHLFFADMALQEEGFGELLPGADVLVFDEAHHLPETAAHFFSISLSSRQLLELVRDIETECQLTAKDMPQLTILANDLQRAVQDMRLAFGLEQRREPWPDKKNETALAACVVTIKEYLTDLEAALKEFAQRSKGLESCWQRTLELIARFSYITNHAAENFIPWFETYTQSFSLHHTPISVAENFKKFLTAKQRSWIFTSATLTVSNSFALFMENMGLENSTQLQLESPFDYQNQALLYVPRGLPDTHSSTYTQAVIEAAIPIIEANQGRTFVLFTSHKALRYASQVLAEKIAFPLLIQGDMPKLKLIEKFCELGNAVLLGTSSFWYGVDVRGDALSCVIIDKLPFSSPDDPILQARIRALRKQGLDPFTHYQLPNAVIMLKQGAGRLIRDITDKGLLMVCDPRLVGFRYGKHFLDSLPPMPRTRDLAKAQIFLEKTLPNPPLRKVEHDETISV